MKWLVFLLGFLLMWFTPVRYSPDLHIQHHAAQNFEGTIHSFRIEAEVLPKWAL